jgi:hypothetical protein
MSLFNKLKNKLSKKESNSAEELDDADTDIHDDLDLSETAEDDGPQYGKLETILRQQVPFIFKLIDFILSKLPKKNKNIKITKATTIRDEDATNPNIDVDLDALGFDESAPEKVEVELDPDEKPKRKLKIIHLIIIGGLIAILGGDMFFPEDEEGGAPAPTVAEAPAGKPVFKKKNQAKRTEDVEGMENEDMGTTDPFQAKPDEAINKEEQPIKVGLEGVPDKPAASTDENVVDTKPAEVDDFADIFDNLEQTPLETSSMEVTDISEEQDEEVNIEDDMDEDEEVTTVDKIPQVKKEEPIVIEDPDEVTDSILAELESKIQKDEPTHADSKTKTPVQAGNIQMTPAPDYEDIGKALVYNCQDKYWACISAKSYTTCQGNYNWKKTSRAKIECYPSAVYETEIDCARAQQLNINQALATDFCQ